MGSLTAVVAHEASEQYVACAEVDAAARQSDHAPNEDGRGYADAHAQSDWMKAGVVVALPLNRADGWLERRVGAASLLLLSVVVEATP